MQSSHVLSEKPAVSVYFARALRAAPPLVLRVAVGFLAGAAGLFGFSPLALPAVAAAWLCLPDAAFVLAGALLGALVSQSYASFSACALFGGAELLLSLFPAPRARHGQLLRAFVLMVFSQGLLIPFAYPLWGDAFFVGVGCLLISPAAAAVMVRGTRALTGYLDGRRLCATDTATLITLSLLLVASLALAPPVAAGAGLVLLLLWALTACRARSGAAGTLQRTRRTLLEAAGVAKGIAHYVGGSVGTDSLAHSQLVGMGEAMERLAAEEGMLLGRKLRLVMGNAGIAMQESPLTGDALAIRRAGDAAIFVLSDGMGTGEAAHRESATAAALLADMLSIGYPEQAAQRGVNDLMLLSGDEMYATLDAARVDLMTGELRMLKFGAPPSYVLREGRVHPIESPALPAGILPEARAGECRVQLRRGDALVMMTDGLMEALGMELLAAIVERVGGANTPEDAAHALIALAVERGYNDDMSALVVRVESEPAGAQHVSCAQAAQADA